MINDQKIAAAVFGFDPSTAGNIGEVASQNRLGRENGKRIAMCGRETVNQFYGQVAAQCLGSAIGFVEPIILRALRGTADLKGQVRCRS